MNNVLNLKINNSTRNAAVKLKKNWLYRFAFLHFIQYLFTLIFFSLLQKETPSDIQLHLAAIRGDDVLLRKLLDSGRVHVDCKDEVSAINNNRFAHSISRFTIIYNRRSGPKLGNREVFYMQLVFYVYFNRVRISRMANRWRICNNCASV